VIYVFHNPKSDFECPNPEHVYCMTPKELVAEVDSSSLAEALELTGPNRQCRAPKVKYFRKCRPTSIGDFLADQMGGWWQVTSNGLNRLQIHFKGEE
jgi:hypothetical protein